MSAFLLMVWVVGACQSLKEVDFINLEAKFQPSQSVVRVNQEVLFQQFSPNEVVKEYQWNFGDNNQSNEREPKHAYREMGTYNVKLVVKKENGEQKETTNKVIVLPNTTTATNTSQFGEKDANGLPTFTDEVGVKTILVRTGANFRYFMLGRKNINGLYIIQTDINRNILWSKNITTIAGGKIVPTDIAYDSVPNLRKALVIVGYVEYNENDKDSFIISLNPQNGEKNWEYINASTNADTYNSLDIVEDLYLVTGNSISRSQSGTTTRIRLDAFSPGLLGNSGVLSYSKNINSPNAQINYARYNKEANEGILAGNELGVERPILLRYVDVDISPYKSYVGGNVNGRALGVTRLSDNRYVLVGELQQNGRKDSTCAFVALFDQDGVFKAMDVLKIYKESFYDVVEIGNNNVAIVGTHYNPLSQHDILVARYSFVNDTPKREAMRLIGGNLNEEARNLIREGDNLSILGTSQTLGRGFLDMWYIKLNANTLE